MVMHRAYPEVQVHCPSRHEKCPPSLASQSASSEQRQGPSSHSVSTLGCRDPQFESSRARPVLSTHNAFLDMEPRPHVFPGVLHHHTSEVALNGWVPCVCEAVTRATRRANAGVCLVRSRESSGDKTSMPYLGVQ
jgi:hypothetical protein